LVIGTSTGGPVALQKILTELPSNYPQPILLVQHMPATFTAAFAARLNSLCKITVKEAENGELLRPGVAYLAPGGTQMLIEGNANAAKLKVRTDDSARITYKPSVDITFGSAAKAFQDKVLGIILTGMGADGREGSRMLKNCGSRIWAQDEQSCVVYGMPQAVASAGIAEQSIPLMEIADRILKEAGHG
jgi:two-component system chemotaxis response regulator CheB